MALDDDADELPSGPPPPPTERPWRHPSELGPETGWPRRPRAAWILTATVLAASLLAVGVFGLMRAMGTPKAAMTDAVPAGVADDGTESDVRSRRAPVWLGVVGTDVEGRSGAVVTSVTGDGPAASAGVVPGDLIVAVDDTTVGSFDDLQAAIAAHEIGDVVVLTVIRASARVEIACVVRERPAED